MREKYLKFISNNRDTITKILSLTIAILLWFFIITEIDPITTKDFSNVEVELRNQSVMREANLELLKHEDYTTHIVVSGRRSAIVSLQEEDISAYVDLGEVRPGTQRLPIHYRLSDDTLTIERSNPTAITVAVDEMVTVQKPVTVNPTGKPGEDYVLDKAMAKPETVSVKGPKQQVDRVNAVVATFPLEGAKDTIISSAHLVAIDEDKKRIDDVDLEPNRVNIQAVISKSANVPIDVVYANEPPNFQKERTILTPTTVLITGKGELVDRVEAIQTKPIDAGELMEANTLEVELILPDGIHLVDAEESVLLRYMKNDMARRTISVSGDNVENVNRGMRVPRSIDVDVYGKKERIESLLPEAISFTVEADGRLSAQVPEDVEVIQMNPKQITTDS